MRVLAAFMAVALLPGVAAAYGGYYGRHVAKKKPKAGEKIEADGRVIEGGAPLAKSTATAVAFSADSPTFRTTAAAAPAQDTTLPGAAPSLLGHTSSSLAPQGGAGIGGAGNVSGSASNAGDACPANMRRVPNSNGGSNCAPNNGAP